MLEEIVCCYITMDMEFRSLQKMGTKVYFLLCNELLNFSYCYLFICFFHDSELWVFGKHYTHYTPQSVVDIRHWLGDPAIYVLDCSAAGILMPCLIEGVHPFVGQQDITASIVNSNYNPKAGLNPINSTENLTNLGGGGHFGSNSNLHFNIGMPQKHAASLTSFSDMFVRSYGSYNSSLNLQAADNGATSSDGDTIISNETNCKLLFTDEINY